MKKLIFILIPFLFLISSCVSNYTEGWVIKNNSSQQIDVYFDNSPVTVEAGTVNFFDDISENSVISIADSYHVNYETSYYYRVNEGKHAAKLLTITDKPKYEYKIFNNTTHTVTFQLNNEIKQIDSGDSLELTVYDNPVDFHFMYEEYTLPYTENLINNISYIYL